MSGPILRPAVSGAEVELALSRVAEALSDRVLKHGPGAYAAKELIDIAVGCVFAIASLRTFGRIP